MKNYNVKNIKLANQGKLKTEWAEDHMPVLMQIRKDFKKSQSLKRTAVSMALHVTKETAVLVRTLKAGGAKVAITSCNPLSTQDDVASALAKEKINVFAWRGENKKEYYQNLNRVLDFKPDITIDDGADLIFLIHKKRKNLLKKLLGGCEETTTGVIRLKAMEADCALKYPVIAVNNAHTKHLFDNRYGTGQSTIDGILRATSVLLAGKTFVVAGYGMCGRGIAARAKGMGSNVIVTETNPVRALEAFMDGFKVMTMNQASKIGDIFVTATGNTTIITKDIIKNMKDGAILANSGHFNVEIDIKGLESLVRSKKEIRPDVVKYELKNKRSIYLLAEGRLVNLACAEGHPSEVMDMSFANQALCVEYIAKHKPAYRRGRLENRVYDVPIEIDKRIALLKLKTLGIKIDKLTDKQRRYLESWEEGT